MDEFIKRKIAVVFVALLIAVIAVFCIPKVGDVIQGTRHDDVFVPGLHEPRTGDTAADTLAWAPNGTEILLEVYFDSRCTHCATYARELQTTLEAINRGEMPERYAEMLAELQAKEPATLTEDEAEALNYLIQMKDVVLAKQLQGKVAFIMVNARQEPDAAVVQFANANGIELTDGKLTFPVLAGATAEYTMERDFEAFPTTFFWLKKDGEWHMVDRVEGASYAPNVVLTLSAFYNVVLHPQLHNVRTGEIGNSLLDFVNEGAGIFYAVYVSPTCEACIVQVAELRAAFAAAAIHPYGHYVDFIIVNGQADSDATLLKFAKENDLSQFMTIVGGASPADLGIPAAVVLDPGASIELEALPGVILFYEAPGGEWHTWGFYVGDILTVDRLIAYFEQYVSWRLLEGF